MSQESNDFDTATWHDLLFKAAESESESALHDRGARIANNENKILVAEAITG